MVPFSQNTWYWFCQTAGWALYYIFGIGMTGIFVPDFSYRFFISQGVITIVLFAVSHLHRKWLKRKAILVQPAWTIIRKLLISNFLLAVLSQLVITHIIVLFIKPLPMKYHWTYSIVYLGNSYIILIIWSV